MRWGILLPLGVGALWLLSLYIAISSVATYAGLDWATRLAMIGVPIAALSVLLASAALYGRRRLPGVFLVLFCAAFTFAFPYHFVWMTGGV